MFCLHNPLHFIHQHLSTFGTLCLMFWNLHYVLYFCILSFYIMSWRRSKLNLCVTQFSSSLTSIKCPIIARQATTFFTNTRVIIDIWGPCNHRRSRLVGYFSCPIPIWGSVHAKNKSCHTIFRRSQHFLACCFSPLHIGPDFDFLSNSIFIWNRQMQKLLVELEDWSELAHF